MLNFTSIARLLEKDQSSSTLIGWISPWNAVKVCLELCYGIAQDTKTINLNYMIEPSK